ncbi:folylpolyglutamate synthase [Coniosporium apollinis]|uniref:Dihydrofolate synthetase n=1 Tax=Coniosporium apollinis TaxID=61459 RepID=A0ABQ9NGB8_9PEZI|nr:folylpolyglutamate synthase [Coniosporium apollinis]
MIELGLERITRLLKHTTLPWKAIHVAGTNGKGSICAAISAMLHAQGVRCGRFTSPHLIDQWDCITINERPVSESLFRDVHSGFISLSKKENIRASEFELLTATAFEVFTKEKVEIAVVETGMGGRLDATNVLEQPLVTIISKIGLDHQAFLGDTLAKIAAEKAGILKPGVPCFIDATNDEEALQAIQKTASTINAGPLSYIDNLPAVPQLSSLPQQPHQRTNLALALHATTLALQTLHALPTPPAPASLLPAALSTRLPGRLQHLSLAPLIPRTAPILLDGAHNADSAAVLGAYTDAHLRPTGPVTYVLAMSAGKDHAGILGPLLRDGDSVVAAEFGPVEGMPWVRAMGAGELLDAARGMVRLKGEREAGGDVLGALRVAGEMAGEGPLVVAGSLYLVGDVLRLLRDRGVDVYGIGTVAEKVG